MHFVCVSDLNRERRRAPPGQGLPILRTVEQEMEEFPHMHVFDGVPYRADVILTPAGHAMQHALVFAVLVAVVVVIVVDTVAVVR